MKISLWKALATCGGIGFVPLAPGTVASLVVSLLYKFFLFRLSWLLYFGLFVLLVAWGIVASSIQASALNQTDPRRIVIDEVCGQLIALAALPADWMTVGLSFLLFRLMDIVKPFPIRKTEKFPGGWGIMADDVVAGLMARLVILIILPLFREVA
ncbi:MAG: phosphatidylglycerophosphatase A family protein [Candidatus Aminicenantales bacterium]